MSTHGLPGPAAGRSISDAKIGKVTGEAAPARVDAIDACRAGSFLRPTIELADRDLFSLCHDLDRPVGTILHPTSQTESPSFTLRRRAKVDALNATTHHQLKLLQGHFLLPAARTACGLRRVSHSVAESVLPRVYSLDDCRCFAALSVHFGHSRG